LRAVNSSTTVLFLALGWINACTPTVWACEPFELTLAPSDHNPTSQLSKNPSLQQPIDIQHLNYRALIQAIFHSTNQARANRKRNPVQYHDKLAQTACLHAQYMAGQGELSHINSQNPKLRTPTDRLRANGFVSSFVSENLAEAQAIQYITGQPYYTRIENSQTIVSHIPNGPPIERHTYLSFTQTLFAEWMKSRGHRRNILSKEIRYTGAACVYAGARQDIDVLYCVQLFAN